MVYPIVESSSLKSGPSSIMLIKSTIALSIRSSEAQSSSLDSVAFSLYVNEASSSHPIILTKSSSSLASKHPERSKSAVRHIAIALSMDAPTTNRLKNLRLQIPTKNIVINRCSKANREIQGYET